MTVTPPSRHFIRMVASLAGLLAVLVLPFAGTAAAQSGEPGWSQPASIVQTLGELGWPVLIPDNAGRLHMLFTHQPDANAVRGIDYIVLADGKWSEPASVIINPDGSSVTRIRAALDAQGTLHVLWDGKDRALYYASVPINQAALPGEWTQPKVIASGLANSDIVVGRDGTLYVGYAASPGLTMIALISSIDGGQTWSEPLPIATVMSSETAADDVSLAVDDAGRLHAAWTEYRLPDGTPPTGAYYTRSVDGGQTWETPQQMAGERHGQIAVGTVGYDEVHLVWRSNIGLDGTYHRRSMDGGKTWLPAENFADGGGFSGRPSFAVDTAGRMHYVIGHAWYAMWNGQSLSSYVDLAGQELRAKSLKSDAESAVLTITEGNQVHAVFETDFNQLWYTTLKLDLPAAPTPTAMPVVTRVPTARPTAVPLPSATAAPPTATPFPEVAQTNTQGPSPALAVAVGVLPALALILVVGMVVRSRQRPL
jgi:hypothetical protein